MREDLRRWRKRCHIFTANVGPINREGRQVLNNIILYRDDGKELGGCSHINTASRPFKGIKKGTKVRFTGEIFEYQRADLTKDYSVRVKKVKPIEKDFA